tara:strand:- start:297 stop:695 length:399 start_codon:yes stop_codon:yes gene_type:complete
MKSVKDWDAILAGMSDGGDSDAGDDLNIMSVQRNAHRVAELVHTFVPGLDSAQRGDTPLGMNRPDALRDDLVASSKAESRRSSGRTRSSSETGGRKGGSGSGEQAAAVAATSKSGEPVLAGEEGSTEKGVLV